jgi:hypothetical protein
MCIITEKNQNYIPMVVYNVIITEKLHTHLKTHTSILCKISRSQRNYMAGVLNPINTTMTTNGKQNKSETTYTSKPLLSIQNTEGDPHPFASSKERVSSRQTT